MKKMYFLLGFVLLMCVSCKESTKLKVTNGSHYYAIVYVDDVKKKELNTGSTSSITIKDASKSHSIYVTLHEYSDDNHYYTRIYRSLETKEKFKWTKDYELVIYNTSLTVRETDKD